MNNVVENKNAVPCESVIPEVRYKPDLPVSRNAFNKFVARIYDVYASNIDLARLMVLVLEAYLLGDMVMAMALLDRHGDRNVFKFLCQEVDVAIERSRRAKERARIRASAPIPDKVPTGDPVVDKVLTGGPKVKRVKTGGPRVKRIPTRDPVIDKILARELKAKRAKAGGSKGLTGDSVILPNEPRAPHSIEMWRRHLQDTKCAGIRIRRAVPAVGGGHKVNVGYKVMRKEDYPCEMNNPPIKKSFINLITL